MYRVLFLLSATVASQPQLHLIAHRPQLDLRVRVSQPLFFACQIGESGYSNGNWLSRRLDWSELHWAFIAEMKIPLLLDADAKYSINSSETPIRGSHQMDVTRRWQRRH